VIIAYVIQKERGNSGESIKQESYWWQQKDALNLLYATYAVMEERFVLITAMFMEILEDGCVIAVILF